jgi:hypothetical protein
METGPIQNVCINHSSCYVLVAEQFLNCSNVVTTFEQMRRKAVPPRKSYTHAVGVLIGFLLR